MRLDAIIKWTVSRRCKIVVCLAGLVVMEFLVSHLLLLSRNCCGTAAWLRLKTEPEDQLAETTIHPRGIIQPKKNISNELFPSDEEQTATGILLFVGILSKISAKLRRAAIRNTWMQVCHSMKDVRCVFFTDEIPEGERDELEIHKDMVSMPVQAGLHFSLRLLEMYQWAVKHYKFDFFLRTDDDYFLCLDHLRYDLMHRPKQGLYWGWIHCFPGSVRVDEGWMITSADIVREVLSKRNTTLPCHPYGDQAMAMWINNSTLNITYFHDNERVIHQAALSQPQNYLRYDICDEVLGLHGAYPKQMMTYWNLTADIQDCRLKNARNKTYIVPELVRFERKCPHSKRFDWRGFFGSYRHQPELCRLGHTWGNSKKEYGGREEQMNGLKSDNSTILH